MNQFLIDRAENILANQIEEIRARLDEGKVVGIFCYQMWMDNNYHRFKIEKLHIKQLNLQKMVTYSNGAKLCFIVGWYTETYRLHGGAYFDYAMIVDNQIQSRGILSKDKCIRDYLNSCGTKMITGQIDERIFNSKETSQATKTA